MNTKSTIEKIEPRDNLDSATMDELETLAGNMREKAEEGATSYELALSLHEGACRIDSFLAMARPAIARIEASLVDIAKIAALECAFDDAELIHNEPLVMQ